MNKYIYIILTLLSLLGTEVSFAQVTSLDDRYNKLYEGLTPEEIERKKQLLEEQTDTLGGNKKNKPKKPYASYLFPDSVTKNSRIFAWKYSPYFNSVERVKVDTLLNGFNQDYFFQAKEGSLGSIYMGNLGAATTPLAYYERTNDYKLSFLNAYKEYLYAPDNVIFYNSKVAFTQFSYLTSGQRDRAEEDFRLTHAQNISPSTDFNITYRNNRTRGMYENQQSINKNFSFAFNHTGKRYTTHFGYIFNSGEMRENGGVNDISEVRDTLIDLPQNILINLKDAKTRFKGNGFYWTQSLAVPLSGLRGNDSLLMDSTEVEMLSSLDSIKLLRRQRLQGSDLEQRTMLYFGTSVEYDSYKKIYTDTKAQSGDFYENWYIDPVITNDSIRETNLNLKFFAQFQPYDREGALSLIGGGIGIENNGYYYFKPGDYLSGGSKTTKSNTYIYGEAEGKWRKYVAWNAEVKYFPFGYRSQDMSIKGNLALSAYIKKRPVTLMLSASFDTQTPSYWVTNFYSNHFRWNNDFKKEIRTNIDAKLKIKAINMDLGFNQLLATNTIYYNDKSLPEQFDGALSVTSLYLYKDFVMGGLHLQHKVLLQTSSNETVAPVPLLGANISYFYRFTVVKNALDVEAGINGSYNSEYYGYGYNPAISQFYSQHQNKVGGYPWFDVFVAGKWKRLRFLLKIQNANYEIFGGRNYFEVNAYPLNRRMLKFGISWSFYN